jgi:DNA-binding MarR family transcriptional regulator
MEYSLVELIEIITKLIGDWELEFYKEYEKEGVTSRQMEYIDVIDRLENPNFGEIAKALNLSKPSVTAIVEKLSAMGYLKKFQSDEDRRSFHVHLSAKGKKIAQMHNETHKRIANLFENNMDSKDLKTLVTLLNKIVSKI